MIVPTYPPNIDAILKVLPMVGKTPGAIFTYGENIHVPSGRVQLPDHLQHHEEVHIKQQKAMGPEKWWDEYLTNPDFRLLQELEAYRAEYKFVMENYNRDTRRKLIAHITSSLSSPMYGNLVNKKLAYDLIVEGQA